MTCCRSARGMHGNAPGRGERHGLENRPLHVCCEVQRRTQHQTREYECMDERSGSWLFDVKLPRNGYPGLLSQQ